MMRTAEFVSPGHPDKICDQISDAILDECLFKDPDSRVAIEVMGGHGIITVTGEMTTNTYVDIQKCVHSVTKEQYGVQINVVRQSPYISKGVDTGGAGDQGIMIGYACDETQTLMPLEYELSRDLCRFLYESTYQTDGKVQITLNEDDKIHSIVASFKNSEERHLWSSVQNWLGAHLHRFEMQPSCKIYCNPAGEWHVGGFDADTGLTGRKIVIDAYGPRVPVGGGAFSGKDPSKVDRSGAYMARKIAVDYLKKREAKECRVELAYAIGKKEPLQAIVWIDGVPEQVEGYDLTPQGIIEFLDLKQPIYEKTARWGHFGNGFSWDK